MKRGHLSEDDLSRKNIKNGYYAIYNADYSEYQYEHRYVMEKHLGRRLRDSEVVHHINGNKLDNAISNLALFDSNAEHAAYHATERGEVLKSERKCVDCGKQISSRAKRCEQCYRLSRRVVDRPSKRELEVLIDTTPMTSIGKMYGVSDNAVRKWCGYYGISPKQKIGT